MTQAQIDGNIQAGLTRTKHGYGKRGIKTPRIYKIWQAMKSRCYDKNNKSYHNYGGSGVTVYNEWKNDFKAFKDWSYTNGYNNSLHLDKDELCDACSIEPKIYSPNTCQWIMQHKNNILENQLHTINMEMQIVKEYKNGKSITNLSKKYYIGIGKSNSAPTKYIEELLRRYGVYKPRMNKEKINDKIIKEILESDNLGKMLLQHNISRSKWYRAKQRYQQRNHTD